MPHYWLCLLSADERGNISDLSTYLPRSGQHRIFRYNIAVVRGQEDEAARALASLEDPERSFIASDFLRLEVLPKALYYQRTAEAALYERFFSKERLIPVSAALVTQAYTAACTFGLSALDALHVTVAKAGGAEEFITTERTTTPLFRVTGIVIKTVP